MNYWTKLTKTLMPKNRNLKKCLFELLQIISIYAPSLQISFSSPAESYSNMGKAMLGPFGALPAITATSASFMSITCILNISTI